MLKHFRLYQQILKNDRSGFTLIELIVSMAILLIVIIPLGGYFVVSADNNTRAELQQQANLLAERRMEDWKARGRVEASELSPSVQRTVEGRLSVELTATPMSNSLPLEDKVTEPTAPKPAETEQAIPGAVLSAVENYSISGGSPETDVENSDNPPVVYTLYRDTDGNDQLLHKTSDGKPLSKQLLTGEKLTLSSVGETVYLGSDIIPAKNPSSPVDLIFVVDSPSPRQIEFSSYQRLNPLNLYIFTGYEASGKAVDKSVLTVNTPMSDGVKVYQNLTRQPDRADTNRLYNVTVTVRRTDAAAGELPLAVLSSYMRTK